MVGIRVVLQRSLLIQMDNSIAVIIHVLDDFVLLVDMEQMVHHQD
jgi:hypothetical protein